MLFAEAMPEDAFRDRLKIYATDADGRRAHPGEAGGVHAEGGLGRARRTSRPVSPSGRRPLQPAQRHPPVGRLRPQRPAPGSTDLTRRPAGLAQHDHVFRARGAGSHPEQLLLRAAAARLPHAGQGGGAAQPHEPVRAARPEAAAVREEQRLLHRAAHGAPDGGRRTSRPTSRRPARCSAKPRSSTRRSRRSWSTSRATFRDQPGRARDVRSEDDRRRPPVPGPRALVPSARAALADRRGREGKPADDHQGRPVEQQR